MIYVTIKRGSNYLQIEQCLMSVLMLARLALSFCIYYLGLVITRKAKWPQAKALSEPIQTSKMECLEKIVNDYKQLTIFTKLSILDVCLDSAYSKLLHNIIEPWLYSNIRFLFSCCKIYFSL